jgi:predicted solute-binding protein
MVYNSYLNPLGIEKLLSWPFISSLFALEPARYFSYSKFSILSNSIVISLLPPSMFFFHAISNSGSTTLFR